MIRLLEDIGATWRIVRLVRSDKITQPLRDRLRDVLDEDAEPDADEPDVETCTCGHPQRAHDSGVGQCRVADRLCPCMQYVPIASAKVARQRHPKLSQLMECPYCLGIWAAALVLLMRRLRLGWLVRLLAVAAVAGEIAAQLDEEP